MTRINLIVCVATWGLMGFTSYSPSPLWAESSRLVNYGLQPSLRQLQLAQQNNSDTHFSADGSRENRAGGGSRMGVAQQNSSDTDFSSDGRSGNRGGGGSRSDCPRIEPPLTALMPVSNGGTTVAERPTFWFYVPYSPEQAPVGEFVLQDEARNDIYRIPFTLPNTPGFVSFKIPSTQTPLAIGKWYRWYFKVYCDRNPSSSPIFVQGWVQRITLTPALENQLKVSESRKDKVYATNRIWFDALDHLANLRLTNSTDAALERDWSKLLGAKGVDLKLPSQVPIVGSVTLSPLSEQ